MWWCMGLAKMYTTAIDGHGPSEGNPLQDLNGLRASGNHQQLGTGHLDADSPSMCTFPVHQSAYANQG